MVASDGPGEYPVITESRAGDDALDVVVTPGTVAYVTTGGALCLLMRPNILDDKSLTDFGNIYSYVSRFRTYS